MVVPLSDEWRAKDMNDIDQATRIAQGDQDEAEGFVRAHYAPIYRMLKHLARSREDAEDLTQETFLRARARIASFRGESPMRSWLLSIAFNEYKQWKRTRRPVQGIPESRSVLESGYETVLEQETLLGYLSQLSEKNREAFVLYEVEELSVREIASLLHVPVGTIKARLHFARKHLQRLVGGREVKIHEQTRFNT